MFSHARAATVGLAVLALLKPLVKVPRAGGGRGAEGQSLRRQGGAVAQRPRALARNRVARSRASWQAVQRACTGVHSH